MGHTPGIWADNLGLHWTPMCGHQELHSCGTSAHHPAGHRLLVSPLHPLGSPGCCFCDSGDSCVCGSMCCVIFRDLGQVLSSPAATTTTALWPLPISELSGCQHLLPYLVPAPACFLRASGVTPPALTAPMAAPPLEHCCKAQLGALGLDPQAQQPPLLASGDPRLF